MEIATLGADQLVEGRSVPSAAISAVARVGRYRQWRSWRERVEGRRVGSVVGVEGGVEFDAGALAGAGLQGAGDRVAPEQQVRGAGEVAGLDDAAVGEGELRTRRDVDAGLDGAVVAERDADARVRADEAA